MSRLELQIIGAAFNSAGRDGGVAAAPRALRSAGLMAALSRHRYAHDAGDAVFTKPRPVRSLHSGLLAEDALATMVEGVRRCVADAFAVNRFPVLLGGDCPVVLGALAASRDAFGDIGLLFVDGHEDAWPPSMSPTGEAADCELGLALGSTPAIVPDELSRLLPLVRLEAVALLGPRDAEELMRAGVPSLGARAWLRSDRAMASNITVETVAGLDHVTQAAASFWLHVDLDVLSTAALSAVDYRQMGGLSWEQLGLVTAISLTHPGCIGWSIAIFNPDIDVDGRGARAIVRYIETASASLHA